MDTIYLAKWETRFWAWLIDVLLVGAIYTGIAGSLRFQTDLDILSLRGFGFHGILMFAYWTFFEGYNGQSIGKMALNLRVTGRTGEKTDLPAAALESFGKAFLLPLDCLVGWLAMPGSKLRLFNRISNTIVIRTKYEEPEGVTYVREKE